MRIWIRTAIFCLGTVAGLAVAQPAELFISEYLEGTSFNKAIEVYNGTGAPVDLAAGVYALNLYTNGSPTVSQTVALTGTLANNDVFVACHTSANAAIKAAADLQNGTVINFNGDDAVSLTKNGVLIDVIGQIGFDPGTAWTGGGLSTADRTLVRKATILAGDPNGSDAFDPSIQWDGLPVDTTSNLGAHVLSVTEWPLY